MAGLIRMEALRRSPAGSFPPTSERGTMLAFTRR